MHWAKVPLYSSGSERAEVVCAEGRLKKLAGRAIRERFNLERWEAVRGRYDPDMLMGPDPWETA